MTLVIVFTEIEPLCCFFSKQTRLQAQVFEVSDAVYETGRGASLNEPRRQAKSGKNRQALTASRQRCQYVAPCSRSKCRHRDRALFKNFHLSVNEVHSYSFIKCQCQHAVPAVSGAFTSKVCICACLCQAVTRLSPRSTLTFPAIT